MRRSFRLSGPLHTLALITPVLFLACTGRAAESQEVAGAIPAELQSSEAGKALVTALAEAEASDRLVFLHTGADW